MADEPSPRENPEVDAATAKDDGRRHISIVAQYAKDLSFENPRAPASIAPGQAQPHGEVSIQVKTRNLGDDKYEILLEFNVESKIDGEVAFIIELVYGGVFTVRGFEDDTMRIAVWVECPRILFPFARRIISDTVRDGGFPPLMLGPIDFLSMYQQRNKADAASKTADA